MRTTATLDEDVFEAVKAQAEACGKELGEMLSELARCRLPSVPTTTKRGLPTFKIRSDAEIIPSSRAKELLVEDAK